MPFKTNASISKGGQGNPLLDSLTPPGDATGRKAVAGVVWREASSVEDFLSKANPKSKAVRIFWKTWRIILNNPTLRNAQK